MNIVKYGTTHCPMCKAMDKEIAKIKIPTKNVELDIEGNEHIAENLNIRSVPVTILWQDGKELYRWNGIVKGEVIEMKIQELAFGTKDE